MALLACTLPDGGVLSAMPPSDGSMPVITQWTNPPIDTSRTTTAISLVPAGTPVHCSGGDLSPPRQVKSFGIVALLANALLASVIAAACVVTVTPLPVPTAAPWFVLWPAAGAVVVVVVWSALGLASLRPSFWL